MVLDVSVPLNYYTVFHHLQEQLPRNCIIVNEGANTMDIGRSMLQNNLPRHRLDAGTFGTMGVSCASWSKQRSHSSELLETLVPGLCVQVGLGFAIAAALWCRHYAPTKRVICVEGDSAFGFSGMEVETMYRYKLPVVIVIVNNSGIYSGVDKETYSDLQGAGEATRT